MALDNRAHELFAQDYAIHGNCRKAAMAIGLRSGNGAHILARPEVRRRVDQLVDNAFAQENVTAARVFRELARIAFADIRGLSDEHGNLLPMHELDDDTAAAISQVKVEVQGRGRGEDREMVVVKTYKAADKLAALTIFAKHYKIIGDVDDGVNAIANALADRLNTAKKRDNANQDAQDARIVDRPALGGVSLRYGVPGDPSNPRDVTNPRLEEGKRSADSLHFDLPGPQVVEAAAPPTATPIPSRQPGFLIHPRKPPGGDDEIFW